MSSKPETTFITSIHKKLPEPPPYHEKNNNPFNSGTPDVFYSGNEGDLWVEYKFMKELPKRPTTLVDRTYLRAKNVGLVTALMKVGM